ncbi:MAG TPA: hypothetical protein VMY79_01230 [Dehalococcoidia bacterium]|nr:hypothetical protein [Dehalococcoidia bacterium]
MAVAFQSNEPEYVLKAKAYQRSYYLKHRDKKIAYQREWWAKNKDAQNAKRRKPLELLKCKRRNIPVTTKQEYNHRYHVEVGAEEYLRIKIRALQMISKETIPTCQRCGETDIRLLTINHLNGDGNKENRKNRFNFFIKRIVRGERSTDDLNVLCYNHNAEYEYIRGRRHLPTNWLEVYKEVTDDGGVPSVSVPK